MHSLIISHTVAELHYQNGIFFLIHLCCNIEKKNLCDGKLFSANYRLCYIRLLLYCCTIQCSTHVSMSFLVALPLSHRSQVSHSQ